MRKDKEQAFELRREGKSYRDIAADLGVPLSTLSAWFSREEWSKEIGRHLSLQVQPKHTARIMSLNAIRAGKLAKAYEDARSEAKIEFAHLRCEPLFIAAMMLYWGEGDKAGRHKVRLTNTDPDMIRLFVIFLKDILKVPEERIRFQLLVYPDLDELDVRSFWIKKTGLSQSNFLKSTLIQGRHKTKRLGYGVCMVFVCSSYLKVKINQWLSMLSTELIEREYYENIEPVADMV